MTKLILRLLPLCLIITLSGCKVQHGTTAKHAKVTTAATAQLLKISKPVPSTQFETDRLISEARAWIGTPYVYGGHSRMGTDCSGLVMELYKDVYGMKLPRSSAAQQEYCLPIKPDDLVAGDLVFFATGRDRSLVSHVGLYIGNRRMIHASGSRGVMESGIDEDYYRRCYHSVGRILAADVKELPAQEPDPRSQIFQELDQMLELQIDSIYVADPQIFD